MAKKLKTKKKVSKKANVLKGITPPKIQEPKAMGLVKSQEQKSNILEAISIKKQEKNSNISENPSTNTQEQIKKNNKLLIGILSLLGLILLSFFTGYYLINSQKSFDYKGVEFNIIPEGKLVFYHTQVPIYNDAGKQVSAYNFYLRTDPRKLAKIEFNDTIIPMKLMAMNYSEEISCSGYGIIALTNIINLYKLIGTEIVIDKNATCDAEGRYMFLNIQKTDENKIEQMGKNCYNLKTNGCDVFTSTERFMLDTFVKIKQDDIRAISSSA